MKAGKPRNNPTVSARKAKETDAPHPKKTVVTALKRFMAAREKKFEKQLKESDHLARFEKARQIALRLSDPRQVALYIAELNEEAVIQAHKHHEKMEECASFWYGPNGLRWLALKKEMDPEEWSAYTAFMDEAALNAFQRLSEKVRLRECADLYDSALREKLKYQDE
jgi:hypothetical protein